MLALLNQRTELRPLLPAHAAELASCVDTHRGHLAAWTVIASRVTSVGTARRLLEEYADPPRYFGLWDHGTLSGGALYRSLDVQSGTCEIGGWLTPQAEGHGLITAAFRQLISWAIEGGMQRIELHAIPDNIRACRIAQRLGMKRDALLCSSFWLNGVSHDSEVWSLQANEYVS